MTDRRAFVIVFVIAVSTAEDNFIHYDDDLPLHSTSVLHNGKMSSLFMACIEATEEAIINSLFAAETMAGRDGHIVEALPVDKVMELMKKYNKIK